jgi:hypothetical protein
MKPEQVHKIANKMGISWDDDKDFMSWCQKTVGKKHLDDMSEVELIMIYNRIKNGKYPQRMKEDVFGHRVTSYSPRDTKRLKNKLKQPDSDAEREEYVDTVEPLMNKKSIIPKNKDKFLDAFVDIDTRVSQTDFEPTIDLDDYKKQTKIVSFKKKEDDKNDSEKK